MLMLDHHHPLPLIVQSALEVLGRGGIILYPTDTVYGLGCDLFHREAIERMYRIRRLPHTKPLAFTCADLKEVAQYAHVDNFAYKIMKRILPGPYTVVLRATKLVPKRVVSKSKTVGIRVPDHPVPLAIAAALGHPIVTTSASDAADTPISNPDELLDRFAGDIDLLINAGPIPALHSTIIDLSGSEAVVLRQGKGDVSWLQG